MGVIAPRKLTRSEADEIIQRKLSWVLAGCAPSEVWLFGSFARGEMAEGSDIDIAIIVETDGDLTRERKRLYSTPRPDLWPQDIIFYPKAEFHARARIGGVASLILQDGRRLYPEDHDES